MPLFDKKDKSRYATFTRRSLGMGGGMTAVFAVLAGRLYQLQIRDGDQYMTEAEDNRVSERLIAPPRGRIIDRFGVELANNRRNYRVLLVAEQASEGVEARARHHRQGDPAQRRSRRSACCTIIAMNKKFVPVPVAENLTWEEFSRINLHLPYLPGVQPRCRRDPRLSLRRRAGAHPGLCRLGLAARTQEHDDDPLLSLPGLRIGKRGIEKAVSTSEMRGQRRRQPRRGQCLWPRHPRAGQGSGRAGRGCLSHHRPRAAALRRPEAGRGKRRLRRDGRAATAMSSRCPRRRASIPTLQCRPHAARNGAT